MRSVQVASVMGLLLAVPAIYLIARRMVGNVAALVGTAVFVLLPEVARIGPDGVADAWHLALAAWSVALVFGVRQKPEDRGPIFLVGAGILAALALLVRVEAVVLIGAMLLGFLAAGLASVIRYPWKRALLNGVGVILRKFYRLPLLTLSAGASPAAKNVACFALGLTLVLVPYLVACDTYKPTQAVSRLLGRAASQETDRTIINEDGRGLEKHATASVAANETNLATFSTKEPGKSIRHRGLLPAIGKVAEETADLFGYWVGLFAIAGALILTKQKTQFEPLDRFAWLLIGLLLATVVWFTAKEGYVTARHLLLLLIPSVGSIGVGILTFSGRTNSAAKQGMIVALVLMAMMLSHLAPHRAHRSAYREAGCWLAKQAESKKSTGSVFDTRGWTSLFSAMPTYQAEQAKDAFADPRLEYIVVMEEELISSSDRSRTLRELLDRGARRVAQFSSPDARRATDALIVYRCQRKTATCDVVSHLACEVKKGTCR